MKYCLTLIIILTVMLAEAPATLAQADSSLPSRLQAALQATYNLTPSYDRHGVAASVIVPGYPQWVGATGTSDGTKPMADSLSFEIGSCTKSFVAALILELRDEGKISLNDSIYHYLPKFKNIDSSITILQLLNHSSGLYDYLDDDPATTLLDDAYYEHPSKRWDASEILSGYVGPPNFAPGKGYRYSNTNYILLGLLVDSILKDSISLALHTRFLGPLGLTHTLCDWDDSIPNNFSHNYSDYDTSTQSIQDWYSVDKTAQLTLANSAGGIVSVPSELAEWSEALYTGKILSKSSTTQLLNLSNFHKLTDGIYYGYGDMLLGSAYDGQYIYGHEGSMLGFVTIMATIPRDSVTIVVYLNSLTDTVTVANYFNALLYQIQNSKSSVAPSRFQQGNVAAYPNPYENSSVLSWISSPGEYSIRIVDLLGRTVFEDHIQCPGGLTSYRLATPLTSGVYEAVISGSDDNFSTRIIRR